MPVRQSLAESQRVIESLARSVNNSIWDSHVNFLVIFEAERVFSLVHNTFLFGRNDFVKKIRISSRICNLCFASVSGKLILSKLFLHTKFDNIFVLLELNVNEIIT